MLNQYAVDVMPGEYTFREHTTGGPPDKIYEESCFLERLRQMLIMEDGDRLWLARATPRAWLAQGKRIAVKNAPSHFGSVTYAMESDVANGAIRASLEVPARHPTVLLRFRHPEAARIAAVQVNGQPWTDFDPATETIRLANLRGVLSITATY